MTIAKDIQAKYLDDIIGRYEVESILGIRPRTFTRFLADGRLPDPVKTLGDGTKLWLRQDIEAWYYTKKP
jgi:predicted DNA-binding transcriptional regulator AlpA